MAQGLLLADEVGELEDVGTQCDLSVNIRCFVRIFDEKGVFIGLFAILQTIL